MYFGAPPFHSTSSEDRLFSLLKRKPQMFFRLHPSSKKHLNPETQTDNEKAICDFMLKCMHPDQTERFQSVEEMIAEPIMACNNVDSQAILRSLL